MLSRRVYPDKLLKLGSLDNLASACNSSKLTQLRQTLCNIILRKIVYFCLPFTGSHSLQIRTQISRLCSAAYPHLNVRFVFRSSTRLSSFFPFKDKVPKFLRSSVVYLFKCRCCSASYVGQTTRYLHTRVSEHLGISPITGKPSSNSPMSSIFSHLKTTGHTASFDDFQILFLFGRV